MSDQFSSHADQVSAPATRAVAVTPHDSNALADIPKALFVGTGGNIAMRGERHGGFAVEERAGGDGAAVPGEPCPRDGDDRGGPAGALLMRALGIGPSLALRQRRGFTGFDFSGGVLPPGASLTRASAATRWSAAGLLVSEAAHAARFDHHPVTRAPRGILIEGAQTNALLRSGELGSTPWSAPGATLTGGQASPDGGTTATLVNDAGASFSQVTQSIAATSGTVCLSAYVRKDAVGKASRYLVLRLGSTIDLGLDTATGEAADIRNVAAGFGVEDCGLWWRPGSRLRRA